MIKKTASKSKAIAAKKPAVKKVAAKKTAAKKTIVKKTIAVKKTILKPVSKVEGKVAVKKTAKTLAKEVVKISTKPSSAIRPQKSDNDGKELALLLAQGMVEKKAEEIKILDMREVSGASTNFLVISHAQSGKQVEAIADSAEDACFIKTKERPWHREGFENLEWVLLDYINVVVHVFQKEKRGFYAIEDLWKDAKILPFKAK
jgi:ribosome-associated protein